MQQEIGHITWLNGIAADAPPCPVCHTTAAKTRVLETANLIAEKRAEPLRLVVCPACRTRYWTDLGVFHYEDSDSYSWSTPFYVEQGASIDDLIEPIARVAAAGIRSCLEIGCGFGFSLDAGRVLFGWRTVGVDPSPLARIGRPALDIDIRPIYADTDTELGGPFDLVYGSEVIEHVATPLALVKICRAHLAPGGILILTTPDGDSVRPDVPASILMPILSPGHHLVLFTADSLERTVRDAGFAFTRIVPRDHGLVLYASDRPITIDDAAMRRGLYHDYLVNLLERPGRPADLRTGIRYRLFKNLVNEGQYHAALSLYDDIIADCRSRFSFELAPEAAADLENDIRNGARIGHFPAPFCLPGLLFFRGMIALNGSPNPDDAVAWFDAAASAASAFREAYKVVGIDDGETGMIERNARDLALLALCGSRPEQAISRLRSFPDPSEDSIESVTFRLIDFGKLDDARASAGLSSTPALQAMVEGFTHLVHGRNPEAHAALAEAAKADGALGLRARSADMLALASVDPDAAMRLGLELGHQSVALYGLFTRLVDLGHLQQAAAIEPAMAHTESWNVIARRGMLALLYANDPGLAAELFARAADEAPPAESWSLKYHRLLALTSAGNAEAARREIESLHASGDAVPRDVRAKIDALIAQHPAIRPTRIR